MEWVLAGMGFVIGIYLLPIVIGILAVAIVGFISLFTGK
jgi:hypothetical protein